MSTTTKSARPLSPHLGIYRWQYTMALSILHRGTGVALSVGLLFLIYWVAALATGAEAFARAQDMFAHPLMRAALVGFSFAFFYHLANGVRHLMWDTGRGLERASARMSGWIALLSAVIITVLFWGIAMSRYGSQA